MSPEEIALREKELDQNLDLKNKEIALREKELYLKINEMKDRSFEYNANLKQIGYAFRISLFTTCIALCSLFLSAYVSLASVKMHGGKGEIDLIRMALKFNTPEQCKLLKSMGEAIHEENNSEWWDVISAGLGKSCKGKGEGEGASSKSQ